MTNANSILSLRPDLIHKSIWTGAKQVWVIKDPLSRAYSYFDEQEYGLLCLADGQRSLTEIVLRCQQQVAPQSISPAAVSRFFSAAYAGGIVLVDGGGYRPIKHSVRSRHWWQNPLAIRVPGINPDRFLDRVVPYLKPLATPASLGCVLLLMLTGFVVAVTHFAELAASLETASATLISGRGLVAILVVVSATKILHELAHAAVCKLFGGDVVELGIMFLLGAPCLYCDVSDAWLFDTRWKRILVSAAGILAELTLASLASIVWLFAVDGPVRDLCVIVIVVCSITTVLFNGNPLLRYDGYFIFSDLIGIPNLAAQSSQQVRHWLRRLVWGVGPQSDARGRARLIGLYGIASGLYRAMLYWLIAWMIYSIANQHNVGTIFAGVIAIAFAKLGWKWIRQILTPPDRQGSSAARRPVVVFSGLALFVALIALIPLPQTVNAPCSIEPAGAQAVFVTRPGTIIDSLEPGSQVDAGTIIARIQNREIERELASIRAECDRLSAELVSLRQARSSGRISSARIESSERTHAAAVRRLKLQEQNASELQLRAPCRGQLFAPRPLQPSALAEHQAEFWTGIPIERSNRGAWLSPGTVVGLVGDRSAREAITLLRQQEIDRVQPNQRVTLRLADRRRGALTGRVVDVATSPAESIAAELAVAANIKPDRPAPAPHYLVRIKLDDPSIAIPIRTVGQAKIYVQRESIASRLAKFLADAFG